ncbi:MAG: peroxiredoxin [Gammaproteobacteria bacterium]|nr:MAG: peroxiredoxin [Gammaproteobacteria bacterium]
MSTATVDKAAPTFTAEATSEQTITLSDLAGKNVILYFYPKDSTSGCTLEGQNFRDNMKEFEKLNTVIFGVSRDSLKSHENFKSKECFPFDLLSDPEEELCKKFDVIKEKNMYGKKHMGIERSTFLIDEKGVLRQEWRKVKVPGHVNEVLEAVKAL